MTSPPLLGPDEPHPVSLRRQHGQSAFLFTADHAGRLIPRTLGTLGLAPADRIRHIAWDIGIAPVTRQLSTALDAPAVLQRYSRLVIDCNRRPEVASAVPEISDGTDVPANSALPPAERARRRHAIFEPYHLAIASLIASRRALSQPTFYVAMHSFTPILAGQSRGMPRGMPRGMHCAVLYDRNPRLSLALLQLLRAEVDLIVAENQPYRLSDQTDYGVPVHAEAGGLDYLEIEIRQDLISHAAGQTAWAKRLARLLPEAASRIVGEPG